MDYAILNIVPPNFGQYPYSGQQLPNDSQGNMVLYSMVLISQGLLKPSLR